MRARVNSERGFSLVEMLISLAVMGVLIPGIVLLLTTSMRWTSGQQEESTLQTEARATIDRLAAELRQTYSADATSPLLSLTPTVSPYLTFLTPDRTLPTLTATASYHMLKVSYRMNGTQLERAQWASTNTTPGLTPPTWTFPNTAAVWVKQIVIKNTPASVFTFYDQNRAVTATMALVRSVDVDIAISTSTAQGRLFHYKSTIALRTV